MQFAHALLLYICAAGVGEALLAGPGVHAPLPLAPAAPHGYQIVLAFPSSSGGGGDFRFSQHPSTFRDALFQLPSTFHPAAPAQPRLFPAANPFADNYLDADDGPTSPYSPLSVHHVAIDQQPFRPRQFVHRDDSGLVPYSEAPYSQGVLPNYDSQRHTQAIGRFGSSRNVPASRGFLTTDNVQDQHASSRNADVQFSDPQSSEDESSQRRPQSVEKVSDRQFQHSQQSLTEFPHHQLQENLELSQKQVQPFYALNDRFSPKSLISERFDTFPSAHYDTNSNNQQHMSTSQKQIQQNRYTAQRLNEYRPDALQSLGSLYNQSNDPPSSFNNVFLANSGPSTEAQAKLPSPTAHSLEDQNQSYQVDVESNGYGYRYAVQSHHNHN